MPNNLPALSEDLRLGRRALEEIEEFQILEDFQWYDAVQRWGLRCRLTLKVGSESLVPEVTDWILRVHPDYPAGPVKLLPAKTGGLTVTFPHQTFNEEGQTGLPWREGDLCLATDLAVLRRQGMDREGLSSEPWAARNRLRWHIKRAIEWLYLASRNQLVTGGDYFELPSYPADFESLLVFSESPASLDLWLKGSERAGFVKLTQIQAAKPLFIVRSFESSDGREILAPPWGSFLLNNGRPAPLGAWILTNRTIALRPWQAPATWGELTEQLAEQGVDLKSLLKRLNPKLRDHDLPKNKRPRHLLLLGFPIPERVGGLLRRIHWLAVELPVLSANTDFAAGFRKGEKGYRQRDASLLRSDQLVKWVSSECWEKNEISGRGRLGTGLQDKRVALLGAGALGSALSELLVRGGVDDLTVVDQDVLEAGNLVRHILGMADIGSNKAEAVARRLDQAAPSAVISGIGRAFPDPLVNLDPADLVIDATGEDNVLLHLQRRAWTQDRWLASIWVGMHARRIYCFSVRAKTFPAETCRDLFEEWRILENQEYSQEEPPRPGLGCWSPVFPARADDIWLAASILVKHLDRLLARGETGPTLAVFEQSNDPDRPGVQRLR